MVANEIEEFIRNKEDLCFLYLNEPTFLVSMQYAMACSLSIEDALIVALIQAYKAKAASDQALLDRIQRVADPMLIKGVDMAKWAKEEK